MGRLGVRIKRICATADRSWPTSRVFADLGTLLALLSVSLCSVSDLGTGLLGRSWHSLGTFSTRECGPPQVEFRDVSFRYPTRQEVLSLNQVSLTLRPGRLVALVGLSGSGKSTLVALLQRHYDSSDGKVGYSKFCRRCTGRPLRQRQVHAGCAAAPPPMARWVLQGVDRSIQGLRRSLSGG